MTSTITTLKVQILDFTPNYRDDFKRLNDEWMTAYFGKSTDNHLDRPEAIIDDGGYILFAEYQGHCGHCGSDEGRLSDAEERNESSRY